MLRYIRTCLYFEMSEKLKHGKCFFFAVRQGVAKAFSIAYHHVDVRLKTMRISESAISWIRRRSPHVSQVTVYMVEPDGRNQDFVLRKMMDTNERGVAVAQKTPPRLERKDNLFRWVRGEMEGMLGG